MSVTENEVKLDYLSEMLEGQVAALSAGYLQPEESLNVLNALKNSHLYRADQQSYILYPNKELPKFLEKNTISESEVSSFALIKKLENDGKLTIMNKDLFGHYHFDGNFNNANSLKQALAELKLNKDYQSLVEAEENALLNLFEKTFNHKAFTGRSGTFFAFEGLGSIYWHMVSKLHLAVYEVIQDAHNHADKHIIDALTTHFREIGEGIGVHKTPQEYGAFPTDPYSHTPAHKGAQQPGMTGQVKEDVLTRIGELGLFINNGQIHLNPFLLNHNEFLNTAEYVDFISIDGIEKSIQLNENSLAFSFCQVPIIYQIANDTKIIIHYHDETSETINTLSLSKEISAEIFKRTGKISKLDVQFKKQ